MISNTTNHIAKLSGSLALVAMLLALPSVALASPDFPDVTRDYLDLDCTPQCTICHVDNYGGDGTATRPFGNTMLELGVVGDGDDSLRDALDELAEAEGLAPNDPLGAAGAGSSSEGTDSDGDGMDDIRELKELRDPSLPGVGDMCKPDVRYGCGARVEPRSELDLKSVFALGTGALLLGLLVRRRFARDLAR